MKTKLTAKQRTAIEAIVSYMRNDYEEEKHYEDNPDEHKNHIWLEVLVLEQML